MSELVSERSCWKKIAVNMLKWNSGLCVHRQEMTNWNLSIIQTLSKAAASVCPAQRLYKGPAEKEGKGFESDTVWRATLAT